MAITKIHPIKTTLDLSIDYICDSEKTDEQILIHSYKCGYKTAALQFANTKEIMNSQSKNLGRHLIQSFMPDEVSPALAHQIGQELCEKHLKGKYEFVMTTHVDRGHIHNHIIFNNVSFVDGKAYNSNKKSYHQIRNQSDVICNRHGLSFIKSEYRSKINGISYKEHQERFTRSKTIGPDYTESRIKERIDNKVHGKSSYTNKQRKSSKVVDIKSNKLASESIGFARWLKLQNLKNIAATWSTLSNRDITDLQSFNNAIESIHDKYNQYLTQIKYIEFEIESFSELLRHINIYENYNSLHARYSATSNRETLFQQYEKELILYLASKEFLKNYSAKMPIDKSELNIKINSLSQDLKDTKHQIIEYKRTVSEINLLKQNLKVYLYADKKIIKKNYNI